MRKLIALLALALAGGALRKGDAVMKSMFFVLFAGVSISSANATDLAFLLPPKDLPMSHRFVEPAVCSNAVCLQTLNLCQANVRRGVGSDMACCVNYVTCSTSRGCDMSAYGCQ